MKHIIHTVLLLALTMPAYARMLFVEAGGTGTVCEISEPCGSVQQAVDQTNAGDHIRIGTGIFVENITIPLDKANLVIAGNGQAETVLQSAGADGVPKFAPADVPVDIVLDIFAPDVTVHRLTIIHPEGVPTKRDIGIFIRPTASNVKLANLEVQRLRTGSVLEPTAPGSRGLFVIRATGTDIRNSTLHGNYQDHIHLPTSQTTVLNNDIMNATRIGIVVIQETPETLSTGHVIRGNHVSGSGSDGIQIQGDDNLVQANRSKNNGGYGIVLCGPGLFPACVPPGDTADASGNVVLGNRTPGNTLGTVADYGSDNTIKPTP
ncbi:MAG: DUF1565 domain-containing protein [Gammaproteobacteria bacterium]|nr:DUF1565 domain-containing protein [Gammaproteobacteria bacterium]